MFNLLALFSRNHYWKIHSLFVKGILRLYGIHVGANFYIEGIPKLKIRGKHKNILIGDNVSIFGGIDIRNRANGRIIIGNSVNIDNDCRLVVANDATLSIGENTGIGPFSIINCGEDVKIGKDCLISGLSYIQSSDHEMKADQLIRIQGYRHSPINIGDDVWIGADVTITRGVTLGTGCVVGSKSLVRHGIYDENSIMVGVPAKPIKMRR